MSTLKERIRQEWVRRGYNLSELDRGATKEDEVSENLTKQPVDDSEAKKAYRDFMSRKEEPLETGAYVEKADKAPERRSYFGELFTNPGRAAARNIGNLYSGAVDTAGGLTNMLPDVGGYIANNTSVNEYLPEFLKFRERLKVPSGKEVTSSIDEFTKGTSYSTAPQTLAEEKERKIVQSIPEVLGYLPIFGGVGKSAQALGKVAQKASSQFIKKPGKALEKAGKFFETGTSLTPTNIGAAIGASAAPDLMEAKGAPSRFAASALGATLGGGLVGGVANIPKNLQAYKENPEYAKQFKEAMENSVSSEFKKAGVKPTANDILDLPALRVAENVIGRSLVGQGVIKTRGNQLKQLQKGLGLDKPVLDESVAGELVKKGASNYADKRMKEFKVKYDKINENFSKIDTSVPMLEAPQALEKAMNQLKKSPEDLKRVFDEGTGKKVMDILGSATKVGNKVDIAGIKQKVSDLRAMQNTLVGQIGDEGDHLINSVVKGLKADIDSAIIPRLETLDKKAVQLWKNTAHQYMEFAKDDKRLYNEIIGKYEKHGSIDAYKELVRDLNKMGKKTSLTSLGLSKDEAHKLSLKLTHDMGYSDVSPNKFSIFKFAKNWDELDPVQKKALYPDADLRKKIDNISKVSHTIQKTFKEANTSGTAYHERFAADLFAAASSFGQSLWFGDLSGAASFSFYLAASFLGSKALTSKRFAGIIDNIGKAKTWSQLGNSLRTLGQEAPKGSRAPILMLSNSVLKKEPIDEETLLKYMNINKESSKESANDDEIVRPKNRGIPGLD